MRDNFDSFLEVFYKIEEWGGQASMAVTTDSCKTKIKFAARQPAPVKGKRSGAHPGKCSRTSSATSLFQGDGQDFVEVQHLLAW